MRLAGSDDIFQELSACANQSQSADHVENVIEQIEILRAKGLGDQAAIEHGLNIWSGKEESVAAGPRFAAIYGDGTSHSPLALATAINLIEGFEVETQAYLDPVGIPTICAGLRATQTGRQCVLVMCAIKRCVDGT